MALATTLIGDFDRPAWKQLFAEALIRLCPTLNPDVADEVADMEYSVSKELGPCLAAGRWAEREWQVPLYLSHAASND